MQLSNASVESFADGVLTLAFAQAGIAKGFLTGGYDKDLGQVLADMFGLTPVIRTSVGDPGGSGQDPIPERAVLPAAAQPGSARRCAGTWRCRAAHRQRGPAGTRSGRPAVGAKMAVAARAAAAELSARSAAPPAQPAPRHAARRAARRALAS